MATIVAGHFEHVEQLQKALELLAEQGFSKHDYATYYLNPAGQHGLFWLGGDARSDEGSRDAGKSAAVGAVVGGTTGVAAGTTTGLMVGSIGGPIGALAGAGVGAYLGALIGALKGLHAPEPEQASVEHPVEPMGGPMVAIHAGTPGSDGTAIVILERCGAQQISRAQGTWKEGEWIDFDPRAPIDLIKRDPA